MNAKAIWVASPLFSWKIAVCVKCTEPLMRIKNEMNNRYAYYCPVCQVKHDEIVDPVYQHQVTVVNSITE